MDANQELTFTYDLSFDKPRHEAFAYLKQIKRRKEFMYIVDDTIITKKVQGENLNGMTFKETTHFLGFELKLAYVITAYTENKIIGVRCNDGPFYPYMEIILAGDNKHKCSAVANVSLKAGPLHYMPMFALRPAVEAIINQILKKLISNINAL